MSATTDPLQQDKALAENILRRVAEDLAMVIDRPLEITVTSATRVKAKPAVKGGIHVSFRIGVLAGGKDYHGCVMLPLADAISLASYLMMVPDDSVKVRRSDKQLDRATKDAMLEVGNFIGGSTDAALRDFVSKDVKAKAEGCQGVASGAKPAFAYTEGSELVQIVAKGKIHSFPPFDLLMLLPPLG